jgi:hypothetical protein
VTIGGCRHAPALGYNLGMARLRPSVRGALLLFVALAIALGTAVPTLAADPRDPRCDAWEAGAPPPGTNMAAMCPTGDAASESIVLDKEPLIPYVVGLVVMALVLGTFGVVAMRVMAPKPVRRNAPAKDWWACPSCGERNRPDRAHCFACQASRDTVVAAPAAEDPHPA